MSFSEAFLRATRPARHAPLALTHPRVLFCAITLGLTALVVASFGLSVTHWTPMAVVALPLVAISAAWIAGGAATSVIGIAVAPKPAPRLPVYRPAQGKTAVLITVCGEDTAPLARYLDNLRRSLDARGLGALTRIFVLSDTRGEAAMALEEANLGPILDMDGISYHRRRQNTGRKPGNIARWFDAHGRDFDYMLVLDADSRMSPDRIQRMIGTLDARPGTGLLQAAITLIPANSRFGRHQRTASRLLTPVFVRGYAAWTDKTGNYWGHNALIRTAAFAAAAKLPELPGRAPLGGQILSHDFVEAAWIRRAGWAVELDPDLSGSAEDGPQTVEEFHRRDRRWCQGNLQHLRLLGDPGVHPVSRFHFLSGAFGYLAAPVWFALIVLIASGAVAIEGALSFAMIALLLLLPKLCALPGHFGRARTLRRRAVLLKAAASELAVSTLLAPLIMVRQSVSVGAVLIGRDCGWKSGRTSRFVMPRGGIEALAGLMIAGLAALSGPSAALWLMPLVVPLLTAPLLLHYLDAEPA